MCGIIIIEGIVVFYNYVYLVSKGGEIMIKFQKDKNKIKSLKVKKGLPLFINFCYNQKVRYELNNSKLFIENNKLHYHIKSSTGGNTLERVDSSTQYIVNKISNYELDDSKIIITGNIEQYKNGDEKNKKNISNISIYRIYNDESKLIDYLENNKE